jgi:signal transduction histidine kinase
MTPSLAGLVDDGAQASVLIVEDDPASARVLGSILKQAGYRVSIATDGHAAIRALESEETPDLLVLDWMLPGISGLEVCHWARERWNALALPILMVTAKTDPESAYAAFDAGASDYIPKPFRGAEIRARIAAHLRTKRLVEERVRLEEHLREREKLSALGLVASGVAHDLNNPLAVIGAQAQILLRGAPDEATEAGLREILAGVERCTRIVGDLLGFARRHPLERKPVDVADVLRATVELRHGDLRAAGIHPVLEVPGSLPPVVADAHQLQQVFLNILINAEQALREGGRTLRVAATVDGAVLTAGASAESPRTSVGDGAAGAATVRIDISNDGPAIPPDVLPQIFDPLFTTKSADEGTGLGLAISRRIVREHGGEIECRSDDAGTVFSIRLPVGITASGV